MGKNSPEKVWCTFSVSTDKDSIVAVFLFCRRFHAGGQSDNPAWPDLPEQTTPSSSWFRAYLVKLRSVSRDFAHPALSPQPKRRGLR
eukprot:4133459-Amphidinium_carterae.1